MPIKYQELKEAVYIWMGILGFFLLIMSRYLFSILHVSPGSLGLSSLILAIAGLVCLLFAIVTFIIRDDPEVWN